MLLFACAPLHMRDLRLSGQWQIAIVVGLLLMPLLMHRPLFNLSKFHGVIYCTPVYLVGMLTSLHWKREISALALRADASFGIFFLHPLLIFVIARHGLLPVTGHAAIDFTLWFTAITALSYILTRMFEKAFGAQSRRLIGA
ncbi:hypothetical protein [Thioclava sp.]|uniref:hypothetical protein n=1 Tax=Thioclava sp. TaxID=1933450 RepID=UPI003AA7E84C